MHGAELAQSIEFQMSLLLFVALAGYVLAARIAQPAVVGEILVGLIIGPSVLGWITYTDFVASIVHCQVQPGHRFTYGRGTPRKPSPSARRPRWPGNL